MHRETEMCLKVSYDICAYDVISVNTFRSARKGLALTFRQAKGSGPVCILLGDGQLLQNLFSSSAEHVPLLFSSMWDKYAKSS